MPKGLLRPACRNAVAIVTVVSTVVACMPLPDPQYSIPRPMVLSTEAPADALKRLASDIVQTAPGTEVVAASGCGPAGTPVIRGAFPERVLFASASDQPAPDAGASLAQLAERIRHDAPGSELTVLGHTDAVGSDAYNMDLSRRRALRVLRALEADGIPPDHLSAVAIGKRQPVATNDTPLGRALNRRVEFLISGCLAANLAAVQAREASDVGTNTLVDVLRLSPSAEQGLATVDQVSLRPLSGDQPGAATVASDPTTQSPALQPPARVARPAPAPHYQPRILSPDAQQNPLGPAVPY